MKRILAYLLVLNLLLLSACSTKQQSVDKTEDTAETVTSTEAISNSEITESETENQSSEDDVDHASDKDNSNSEKSDSSDNSKVDNSKPQKETQTTSATKKPDKNDSSNSKETTTKSPVETSSEQPSIKYATKADEKAIADKIVEYINSYRSVPATKLPGLTKYAEYRSRQLVTNFAHDTKDERAAATALKYGEYIDPSLYGAEGEPYYRANARSAIAKAQYRGTVDEIAKSFATLARDSAGHWAYVGSSEYKYIAVGVTYSNGTWYCDIAVASENTDEY